jgi:hypothetical protein
VDLAAQQTDDEMHRADRRRGADAGRELVLDLLLTFSRSALLKSPFAVLLPT